MKPLSAPVKVSVDITDRCTLKCSHCRLGGREFSGEPLAFGTLCEVLDDLVAMKVFRLGVSGGEPFLRHDLEAIVEYALQAGIPRVFISTNGTLMSGGRLAALRRFHDRITFKTSIDGPRRIHDEVRGAAGAFQAASEGIGALRKEGFEVHVTTTLTKLTAAYLPETLRLVGTLGCSRHYVVEVIPTGRASPDAVMTPEERKEAGKTIRQETPRLRRAGYELVAKIPFLEGTRFGFECCAGASECGVMSDGLITGCRLLPDVHEGYVQDSHLSAVWRSREGFAYFRRELPGRLGAPCQGCKALARCRGGCRACAVRTWGREEGPDPRCPRAASYAGSLH